MRRLCLNEIRLLPVDPISDPSAAGERSGVTFLPTKAEIGDGGHCSFSPGFTEIASSSSAKAAANVKRFRVARIRNFMANFAKAAKPM